MCGASIRWLEMVREGGIMLIIRHEKALIKVRSKARKIIKQANSMIKHTEKHIGSITFPQSK